MYLLSYLVQIFTLFLKKNRIRELKVHTGITYLHPNDCSHATWLRRVPLTAGNRSGLTGYRSNRSGPVPVSAGTQPAKIQNLNLNSKNEKFLKKFLKILQSATNLMVSNFLKNSFI